MSVGEGMEGWVPAPCEDNGMGGAGLVVGER